MRNLFRAALIFSVAIAACGKPDVQSEEGRPFTIGGVGEEPSGGAGTAAEAASDGKAPSPSVPSEGGGGQQPVAAGTLTAGAWDDNLNYAWFQKYRATLGQKDGMPTLSASEQDAANAKASAAPAAKSVLDIALVIDTTGSMGDEIRYLQAEFTAISQTVHDKFPNAQQRWALVLYRDEGDAYVLKGADFGTGIQWFQNLLNQQSAGGGGDFPEAPEQALAHAATLSWRDTADTAKLVFWVADAPHHNQNAGAMTQAMRDLALKGVHVYPVASSGVDELTEYTMRATAQLTGGRYVFLTDDSGVGGTHKEPSIPCYDVSKLDEVIERMVTIEMSGAYLPTPTASIIRTVGQPSQGQCVVGTEKVKLY